MLVSDERKIILRKPNIYLDLKLIVKMVKTNGKLAWENLKREIFLF